MNLDKNMIFKGTMILYVMIPIRMILASSLCISKFKHQVE